MSGKEKKLYFITFIDEFDDIVGPIWACESKIWPTTWMVRHCPEGCEGNIVEATPEQVKMWEETGEVKR